MTTTPPRLAWRWHLLAADGSSPANAQARVGMDPENDPGWIPVRLELDR